MNSYYRSARYQKGHGVGSVLSKLFKSAIPYLKDSGKYLAKQGLKTAVRTATDIMDGDSPRDAFRKRMIESKDNILDHASKKIKSHFIPQAPKKNVGQDQAKENLLEVQVNVLKIRKKRRDVTKTCFEYIYTKPLFVL